MNKRVYGNISFKLNWQGEIVAIQPRTRVWRYLMDNRTHYHLGYNLFIVGDSSEGKKQFSVAISEKQQVKGLFRIGDVLWIVGHLYQFVLCLHSISGNLLIVQKPR